MKIVQVATAMNAEEEILYAVDSEGKIYLRRYISRKTPTEANPYACDWSYYWEPQDYPVGVPERFKAQADKKTAIPEPPE